MSRIPPRSDGSTFNIDFEAFCDTLICARNAGVIQDYQTRASVLHGFAYRGTRCAFISVQGDEEPARLQLIPAYDAVPAKHGAVLELVFSMDVDAGTVLRDWPIVACRTRGGAPGRYERRYLSDPVFGADGAEGAAEIDTPKPALLELRANPGSTPETYAVDVVSGDGLRRSVVDGLDRRRWTRFILHRSSAGVALYVGEPGAERYVDSYADLAPEVEVFMVVLGNPDAPDARGAAYWDQVRLGRPREEGVRIKVPEQRIPDVGSRAPERPEVIELDHERQLFVDQWCVEELGNVRRTFHRPVKHPDNPILVPDRPWEKQFVYLAGGVERTPRGSYRMWYCAPDPTPENRKNTHTCLAESDDGIRWYKPELEIHSYESLHRSNIVIRNAGGSLVFHNPEEPRFDFRYLAKIRHQGTQGWSSADGLRWHNHGVILPQSLDASCCNWDPVRRKYVASVKLGYKGRRYRGYAESDDFLHWTDTYLAMDVDETDAFGDQLYAMSTYWYESLYLATVKLYHVQTTDLCDLELAVSHNGRHWERPFRRTAPPYFATQDYVGGAHDDPTRQPFIPGGLPGSWDFGNLDMPATPPIRDGEELRFYYGGRTHSHNGLNPLDPKDEPPRGSVGLATLRIDGFVSADAGATDAYILTRPLRLNGRRLFVNGDFSRGQLNAEICTLNGAPIGGYSTEQALPVREDGTRIECRWEGGPDIRAINPAIVRLRFTFRAGSLYSFWCE